MAPPTLTTDQCAAGLSAEASPTERQHTAQRQQHLLQGGPQLGLQRGCRLTHAGRQPAAQRAAATIWQRQRRLPPGRTQLNKRDNEQPASGLAASASNFQGTCCAQGGQYRVAICST